MGLWSYLKDLRSASSMSLLEILLIRYLITMYPLTRAARMSLETYQIIKTPCVNQ